MNKKTVLNILKIFLSAVLCITAVGSALFATALKGVRTYFSSEEFYTGIEDLDLRTVTFTVGGKKVTVSEYVNECAEEYLKDSLPLYFPIFGTAVDKVLSSEAVDKAVKEEALECVDFFLQSDREEAEERIENGVKIEDNESLDPLKAQTPIEAVKIYVRAFVLANVEKNIGLSCDQIIVLLSEKTTSNLIILAVAAALLLLLINYRTIFNVLLYSGAGAFIYGITIKALQGKFNGATTGNEELIGFYVLTPLVETFSPKAVCAVIIGAVLIILFVAVYFLFKKYVNNEKTPE